MNRLFIDSDNGKRFSYMGNVGTLEFPLTDPGSAGPDEGIIWYDSPRANGFAWEYVKPIDVDPYGWSAEPRTMTERHTPERLRTIH